MNLILLAILLAYATQHLLADDSGCDDGSADEQPSSSSASYKTFAYLAEKPDATEGNTDRPEKADWSANTGPVEKADWVETTERNEKLELDEDAHLAGTGPDAAPEGYEVLINLEPWNRFEEVFYDTPVADDGAPSIPPTSPAPAPAEEKNVMASVIEDKQKTTGAVDNLVFPVTTADPSGDSRGGSNEVVFDPPADLPMEVTTPDGFLEATGDYLMRDENGVTGADAGGGEIEGFEIIIDPSPKQRSVQFGKARLVLDDPGLSAGKHKVHPRNHKSEVMHAVRGQFPFVASLRTLLGSIAYHKCAGTLIAPKWILSAAHCLCPYCDQESTLKSYLGNTWAVLGDNDLSANEPGEQWIKVKSVEPSKEWKEPENRKKHIGDIMLVQLEQEATPGEYVQVASLPRSSEMIATGTAIIVGWRGIDSGKGQAAPIKLQYAAVSILDGFFCNKILATAEDIDKNRSLTASSLVDSHLCAGYSKAERDEVRYGPGIGDPGAPLICTNGHGQRGDVTKEPSAYVCGVEVAMSASGGPTIFSSVSHYLPWIDNIVGQRRKQG